MVGSLLAAAALLVALPASAPAANPSIDTVFASLQKVRGFHDASISPDGRRVAWSWRAPGPDGGERLGAISVAELPSGAPRRVSAAADGKPRRELEPVFSPDGQTLAFLSDAAAPKQLQVYLAPAAGGKPKALTSVKGQLQELRWAPDGKSVSFLFVEGSEQEPGALTAHKRDSGPVEENLDVQRIAVADVATGRVRSVSPADLYVYDYDWSPDGKSFAAEAATGSGTNNYWLAQLYVVDAASGAARSVWKPSLQIACPRFSPDGRTIAVIHGIMSDEGSNGGDVWAISASPSGAPPRNLTPEMEWSAARLAWRSPSELLFAGHRDGGFGVVSIEPATGKQTSLFAGAEKMGHFGVARTGDATVAIRESFENPPEVWAGPVGAWKKISSVNGSATRFWGEAKSLHWKSDGGTIQGWLLFPQDFDPAKRYPMVVLVHGGPSGASTASWPSRWQGTLPSQGYFVFMPNPRGSFGFGEAFAAANVKDFGGGDLRDILAGLDTVVTQSPVDAKRLGITGWSYGGYMTMWAVTQTDRFAAGVAGAGIASWQSYYGQNKIDQWMLPFFGASVYDDPGVYAKSSPMEFIKKVKTPTLVLHGERDSEVPTPQGYEFWHALKALGVPTRLVIYTDEGHSIRKPENQKDIVARSAAWFDQYLKP